MDPYDDDNSIMMKTLTSGFVDPEYLEEEDNIPEKVLNLGDEFLPRSGHSATLIGDVIYIFGGIDSASKVYDSLLAFDTENKVIKKMKTKGILPKARSAHAAWSDILQTRVYIHGGADNWGNVFNDLVSYNPLRNRFEKIETTGEIPPPLYGHSLVPHNQYLYLFGGTSGFDYFNDLYRLDLLTKVWTKLKPAGKQPEHRYKHCVVCNYPLDPAKMPTLCNDDPDAFYVVGGMNEKTLFGNIYKYHFSKDNWETIKIRGHSDLFKGRFGHTWVYFNESIYVFGGWADKKRQNDLLRFDFKKLAWKKEEVGDEDYMPSERDFHASVLHHNYFYVIGGSDKKVKLNEIHRIKIKDETPSRSIHKDLGRLLTHLEKDHLFADLRIHFKDEEGNIKHTIFTYYPLVSRRAPEMLQKMSTKFEHGLQIFESQLDLPEEPYAKTIKYVFEYVYTNWIDFTDFDTNVSFPLLRFCIKYRILRLMKLIARYICFWMNFANAVENLNSITTIEQEFDIGDQTSKDKEWNQFGSAFTTLKKAALKFITTHHMKFQGMKQYEELNPYSVLSIDGYLAETKLAVKKKSPYAVPKKTKPNPTAINTNLLHVDRITKGDEFVKELKDIFDDKQHKNYKIHCDSHTYSVDMFILAGRSDYFLNMFLSQMKESVKLETNVQLPRNVEASMFKTFIKYLYWDDLALPSKLDLDESMYLFECADFYQIPNAHRLKTLCESRVKTDGKGDPCEVLEQAELLGAKKIKKAASDVIKRL